MSTATVTNETIRTLSAIRLEELHDCRKLAKMPLREAGWVWLETRKPFIDKRTAIDYGKYIEALIKFFGNVPLETLANPDMFRAYQIERSKTCKAYTVNHELNILQQLLRRIRRWEEVQDHYEPIPLPKESPGRALSPDEERRVLQAGASRPGWARAHNMVILSLNTAAGPSEMLGLKLQDVFVDHPDTARIFIHDNVKNKFRVREAPLNVDALGAVKGFGDSPRKPDAGVLSTT